MRHFRRFSVDELAAWLRTGAIDEPELREPSRDRPASGVSRRPTHRFSIAYAPEPDTASELPDDDVDGNDPVSEFHALAPRRMEHNREPLDALDE